MNIQTTTRKAPTANAQQSKPSGVQVEVHKLPTPSTKDVFVRTAAKAVVGAGEGLFFGAMSNSYGFAPTVLGASVGGAVVGAVKGRAQGKALDKKLSEAGLPEEKSLNFTRKETIRGGLNGYGDAFAKSALIAGMTQLTGGNLLAGVATGAALSVLDIF